METTEEFPFPFPPYPIQNEFMKELYKCLEDSKLGIFESPTGTGKSMSIICGSLKWLLDYEEREKDKLNGTICELDEQIKKCSNCSKHWFVMHTEQLELNTKKQASQAKLNSILQYERKKNALKEIAKNVDKNNKAGPIKRAFAKDKTEKENDSVETSEKENTEDNLLLEEIQDSENSEDEDKAEEAYENTKIFFCSRTHSQLSQFIGELKKSPYSKNVSVITLASRQNYCINKNVKKLKHLNLINECCLQLQKKKTTVKDEKDIKKKKVSSGCPFVPGNQDLLIGETLMAIQDVEEIVKNGENLKTCPYYGSRKALPHNQLILIPYNSILHKNTRVSSGINLKGNILIIDEAHNLLEAIERIHSVVITGRNLLHCYSQLCQYQKRFQALFSAKNVLSLSQLSFCLKKLLTVLGASTKSNPDDPVNAGNACSKLYKMEEFDAATEIDTVNIFELLKFIKNSRLSYKLQGFTEQFDTTIKIHKRDTKTDGVKQFLNLIKADGTELNVPQGNVEASDEERPNNPIISIIGFLECLQSSCSDGRVFVVPGATVGQGVIKFLLMNPAAHFHDIDLLLNMITFIIVPYANTFITVPYPNSVRLVRDARAVILAGGTMAPMHEFTEQLFLAAGAAPERIVTFSCDHVVPKENIVCSITTRGPSGVEFEFNFQNRQNTKLLDELGRALLNLCNIVPAGIVIFLPSYNFEEVIYKHLEKTGLITKLSMKKRIFREPKLASQVNEILEQYSLHVKKPQSPQNGSLLFSVVGGKLSEGLNFSDDLGRCVVVVGMPYPNIKSLELQEKIKYLNENVKSGAGQNFYENSCMKAVNQCIGRAIRHINDYSTVVLLDKRYTTKTKALPNWIQRTLVTHDSFGKTIGTIGKFFTSKKNKPIGAK